jgi:hypothetical protein
MAEVWLEWRGSNASTNGLWPTNASTLAELRGPSRALFYHNLNLEARITFHPTVRCHTRHGPVHSVVMRMEAVDGTALSQRDVTVWPPAGTPAKHATRAAAQEYMDTYTRPIDCTIMRAVAAPLPDGTPP